jgi:plastocyanin
MRVLRPLVVGIAALATVPTAAAATAIAIVGGQPGYSPASVTRPTGTIFVWKNMDSISHTTTQRAGFWDSGSKAPGQSFAKRLRFAGTFGYICTIHPFTMRGTVKLPVRVRPSSGGTGTTFTITVATVPAPAGVVYDVQKRKGKGAWVAFRRGLKVRKTTFRPRAPGTFSFRARARKTAIGMASGFSPARRISVS